MKQKSKYTLYIILVGLILIAGYFMYSRRKKNFADNGQAGALNKKFGNGSDIGGNVGFNAHYVDAFHHVALVPLVSIALKQHALREIRRAGNYRYLVPQLHPFTCVLEGSRGRRVAFRGKIIG